MQRSFIRLKMSFYLRAIIKDPNDLYTIEILKSFSVPLSKGAFTYVPLPSILPLTAANDQRKRRFCP
jgi:hypothetical protein